MILRRPPGNCDDTSMRSTRPIRLLGGAVASAVLFAACSSGTPLGDLPPTELDLYVTAKEMGAGPPSPPPDTGIGSAMAVIRSNDPAHCFTLSSATVAAVNSRELDLVSNLETTPTMSGGTECGGAEFLNDFVPLGGDATLTLRDFSGTFRIVSPLALDSGTVSVVGSPDGLMHLGQDVQLDIAADGRAVTAAFAFFVPDGASASSFTVVVGGGTNVVPASVSGDIMSFTAPTTTESGSGAVGHGTLFVNIHFEDRVTTCAGPAVCHVFTDTIETVSATLLAN